MILALALAVASIGFTACETLTPEQKALCALPDNINAVRGENICLAITTFGHGSSKSPVLAIYLHGDVSRGGPAGYMNDYARDAGDGVVSIVMLRPGYYDQFGKRSTGSNYRRRDAYTAENIDAIAAAVGTLRKHHGASKVVLIGHSGGAATSAVLVGRHPRTADAAILVSCPCDLAVWRDYRGSSWSRSLDPMTYVDRVPVNTEVVAITGANDQITPPRFVQSYTQSLKDRGGRARFVLVPDAGHWFGRLGPSPEFKNAVEELTTQ